MCGKIVIYQLLPRLYTNRNSTKKPNGTLDENGSGKFNEITTEILEDLKRLPVSHIWLTGILDCATKSDFRTFGISGSSPSIVKGEAGSPYAVRDYYDVSQALAIDIDKRMEEFEALVERIHNCGMKVIIDFVPNHVAREYHSKNHPSFGENDDPSISFSPSNNFYYLTDKELIIGEYHEFPAKATGNDCFSDSPSEYDWYETVKLNYGIDILKGGAKHFDPIPDTWLKMCEILHFWASKGVDGFRCDMAEMVPVEFWKWVIEKIKCKYPELLFIAEIYRKSSYREYINEGGFDLMYDKVGLYDTLIGILKKELSASYITGSWLDIDDIKDKCLNFMENHDEQRLASDFIIGSGAAAMPAVAVSLLLNTSPFMLYMKQELGERGMDEEGFSKLDGKTTIFDYWSLQAWDTTLKDYYKKLLELVRNEPLFNKGDTFDLQYVNFENEKFNIDRNYAFVRTLKGKEFIICVTNFDLNGGIIGVRLHQDLFNFLMLGEVDMVYRFENLLTGETGETRIHSGMILDVKTDNNGLGIIKFYV